MAAGPFFLLTRVLNMHFSWFVCLFRKTTHKAVVPCSTPSTHLRLGLVRVLVGGGGMEGWRASYGPRKDWICRWIPACGGGTAAAVGGVCCEAPAGILALRGVLRVCMGGGGLASLRDFFLIQKHLYQAKTKSRVWTSIPQTPTLEQKVLPPAPNLQQPQPPLKLMTHPTHIP